MTDLKLWRLALVLSTIEHFLKSHSEQDQCRTSEALSKFIADEKS